MNKFATIFLATAFLSTGLFSVQAEPERKGNSTMLHVKDYGGKNGDKVSEGTKAPLFIANDSNGKKVDLGSFKGKKNILLVFYPGDNTPGCTTQLCAIRDDYKGLEKLDLVVFGVNPADESSHKKFITDHKFPFQLIVDKDKKISEAYDAIGMFGFISRTVVLIDKKGDIVFYKRGMPELKPDKIAKLL